MLWTPVGDSAERDAEWKLITGEGDRFLAAGDVGKTLEPAAERVREGERVERERRRA